jgi:hypothetical protein
MWRRGSWWRVLAIVAAPYVVLGLAGVAAGLPWYRWLGFYVRTVVPAAANVAGRQSTLHLDLLYYPRYLLAFESPLLLLGVGAAAGLVLGRQLAPARSPYRYCPTCWFGSPACWRGCRC